MIVFVALNKPIKYTEVTMRYSDIRAFLCFVQLFTIVVEGLHRCYNF